MELSIEWIELFSPELLRLKLLVDRDEYTAIEMHLLLICLDLHAVILASLEAGGHSCLLTIKAVNAAPGERGSTHYSPFVDRQ